VLEQYDRPQWYIDSCKQDQLYVPEGPRGGLCA